ncbi:MAG: NAD-dependent epimerase/dehydratase family protein [Candidatus Woesearchaeota archaeon]|nr:NAD-dependent epimerase/dehydratase family protein [Candidatus Woesearchaeota archaeon]
MILITGATGFIGKYLVRQLLNKKEEVVCFVRATENGSFLKQLGAKIIYGDITSKNSVEQAFEFFPNISEIIHLAALIKSTDPKEYQQMNVVGTKNVVEVAQEHNIKKIMFLSTDFVIYPGSNPYRDTKLEAENILKASSLNYTVLRPTPVYGVGDDKNFDSVFALVKKYPIIPAITCVMQPVHVEDVVSAIIKCLRSPKTVRREYNLPGGSVVSFAQILKLIAKHMRKRRLISTLPNWILLPALWVYEKIIPHPMVRYYQVHKWTINRILSFEDLKKDIQYKPRTFEKGMLQTMKESGISA